MKWQNVHIFISSTFNDMHAERDYLVKYVLPELSEWCEARCLRLLDVDLRWGVTAEDSIAGNTVAACLSRIDECRPFFLCFLGQRRGWVPAPEACGGDRLTVTYPGLRGRLGKASVTEMEITHALIDPLCNGTVLQTDGREIPIVPVKYAFFYLREDTYLVQIKEPALLDIYTNRTAERTEEAEAALKHWREEVIPKACRTHGRPLIKYRAQWDGSARTPELTLPLAVPTLAERGSCHWKNAYLNWKTAWAVAGVSVTDDGVVRPECMEQAQKYNQRLTAGRLCAFESDQYPLAKLVLQQLQEAIAERYPDNRPAVVRTPLERELDQQRLFLYSTAEGFVARARETEALDRYCAGGNTAALGVAAAAGMGKTALLAHWLAQRNAKFRDGLLFFRFIDADNQIGSVPQMLHSFMREWAARGLIHGAPPAAPDDIRAQWPARLKELGGKGPTVLVIDGIDRLEDGLKDVDWIPNTLPAGVRLIVSFTAEGSDLPAWWKANTRHGPIGFLALEPLAAAEEKLTLINGYLARYLKALDDENLLALARDRELSNPLFLTVLLHELRMFGKYEGLAEMIRRRFDGSLETAFQAVMERVETDAYPLNVDMKPIAANAFGWLSHSRNGLTGGELIGLTKAAQPQLPCADEAIRLVLRQLRPYLAHRENVIVCRYHSLKDAARTRYTAPNPSGCSRTVLEWRRMLISYFETMPASLERRLWELPWQLCQAGEGDKLRKLLLEGSFALEKALRFPLDLAADYQRCLSLFHDREPKLRQVLERLLLLLPVMAAYPDIAKQTFLNGMSPLNVLSGMRELLEELRTAGGVCLTPLGGDVYSLTGRLSLPEGGFLAISPDCRRILAWKTRGPEGLTLLLYDAQSFRLTGSFTLSVAGAAVSAAVSDRGHGAVMDENGRITTEQGCCQGEGRLLLYAACGDLLYVSGGRLCALRDGKARPLWNVAPTLACVRENVLALYWKDHIYVLRHDGSEWMPWRDFACTAPRPLALSLSADLHTVLVLSVQRKLLQYDLETCALTDTLAYVTDAKLPLTRIPFGCGMDSGGTVYLMDGESNGAAYSPVSGESTLYVAGEDAEHGRTVPVAFQAGAQGAVALLPATAFSLRLDEKNQEAQSHIGQVSRVGFFSDGTLYTQADHDIHLFCYSREGKLLSSATARPFPVAAAHTADRILLSFTDHDVTLNRPGAPLDGELHNMPLPGGVAYCDCAGDTVFFASQSEAQGARLTQANAREPIQPWSSARFEAYSGFRFSPLFPLYQSDGGLPCILGLKALDEQRCMLLVARCNGKAETLLCGAGSAPQSLGVRGGYTGLCLSPDGGTGLAYGEDCCLFSLTGAWQPQIFLQEPCSCAVFVNARVLAVAGRDTRLVTMYGVQDGQTKTRVHLPDVITAMDARDGRLLCGLRNGRSAVLETGDKQF